MTEAEVGKLFDDFMAIYSHSWTVQRVEVRVRRCHHCGRFPPAQGYGITKGVADRLVRKHSWPAGMWLQVELKGEGFEPKTARGKRKWSSPEQEAAYLAGNTVLLLPGEKGLRLESNVGFSEYGIELGVLLAPIGRVDARC